MSMLKIIKKLLLQIVEDIDAGNSNISEEEGAEIIETIQKFSRRDEGISKYNACRYLNISRATFDNLVKEGKLPKGKHVSGFKELRFYKKDLDNYIKLNKNGNTKKSNNSNIQLQVDYNNL